MVKKYNERALRRIRQFYDVFSKEKWSTTWTQFCWSHYREVLGLKDINAMKYYLNECQSKNLTIKQLQNIIKNREYDRLSEDTKIKLIKLEKLKLKNLIPNPIIVKINTLDEKLTEYALKEAILNDLDEFLLQLGERLQNRYVKIYMHNNTIFYRIQFILYYILVRLTKEFIERI